MTTCSVIANNSILINIIYFVIFGYKKGAPCVIIINDQANYIISGECLFVYDNNNINEDKIQVEKIDFNIYAGAKVKKVKHGNSLDVKHNTANIGSNIKKLNKYEYVTLKDGEIKEFKKGDQKVNQNLKKTFNNLRQLININFGDNKKDKLFLTLTYKENMTDEKRLYTDVKKFMQRLKYQLNTHPEYTKYRGKKLTYIIVAEPQDRGAWHLHILLKANVMNLYIDNIHIAEWWRHGNTETERLKDVTNMGSYLVAYFTNVSKNKKGSRLHMYPVGFKIYRTSRNIIKPVIEEDIYANIVKEYGEPKYSSSIAIKKGDRVINISTTEQFTKGQLTQKEIAIIKQQILDKYENNQKIVNINVNTSENTFMHSNEINININL